VTDESYSTMTRLKTLIAALAVCTAPAVLAAPVFSVDLDPGQAGIQDSRSVVAGTGFAIQVLLDTDGETISSFGLSLTPGDSVGWPIRATGIAVAPVFGADTDETVVTDQAIDDGTGKALASAYALIGMPVTGGAILLVTLDYLALSDGVIGVDLGDLSLLDGGGIPIAGLTAVNGLVTVIAAAPVPGPLALILPALLGLTVGRRRATARTGR
jgi:hypothetical protein